jgi:hypothetical protein
MAHHAPASVKAAVDISKGSPGTNQKRANPDSLASRAEPQSIYGLWQWPPAHQLRVDACAELAAQATEWVALCTTLTGPRPITSRK